MPALRGFLIVSGYFRLWVRVWVSGFSQTELPGKGRGVCGGTVGSYHIRAKRKTARRRGFYTSCKTRCSRKKKGSQIREPFLSGASDAT